MQKFMGKWVSLICQNIFSSVSFVAESVNEVCVISFGNTEHDWFILWRTEYRNT